MKRIILAAVTILFCATLPGLSDDAYEQQKKAGKSMVKQQYASDIERKEAILRKMREYIKQINGRLKKTKVKVDAPINIDDVTDISKTEDVHSNQVVPPRVFAFVNDEKVRFRTDGSTSGKIIGMFDFAEQVEVIVQSTDTETIDGATAPWYMVRRANDNEDEGWVFGAFLSKEKPAEKPKETGKPAAGTKVTAGDYAVPTTGFQSSAFGYRVDPISKKADSFHSGIDIAAPNGTKVTATAAGEVLQAEFNQYGYGNMIIIQHDKDVTSLYGHLQKYIVKPGQKVAKGEQIGMVDTTGYSTGPHLHFEIRKGGTAVDPNAIMR
ncbi:MAG: hypothetical protein EPN93_18870 [Spirochaetes bacterium]|nr:MAG: hypothetical protein EPN93_18870 [Spirochaetota bacterium]